MVNTVSSDITFEFRPTAAQSIAFGAATLSEVIFDAEFPITVSSPFSVSTEATLESAANGVVFQSPLSITGWLNMYQGATATLSSNATIGTVQCNAGSKVILGPSNSMTLTVDNLIAYGVHAANQEVVFEDNLGPGSQIIVTNTCDAEGVFFDGLGSSGHTAGVVLNIPIIAKLSGCRFENFGSNQDYLSIPSCVLAPSFDNIRFDGVNLNNINVTGSTFSPILCSPSNVFGGGSRFGEAYDIDPSDRVFWQSVPLSYNPDRNSADVARSLPINLGVTFDSSMTTPTAGDIMVRSGFRGFRQSGSNLTLSSSTVTTNAQLTTLTPFAGEMLEVSYTSGVTNADSAPINPFVYRLFMETAPSAGKFDGISRILSAAGTGVIDVQLADMDGDGNLDIVIADPSLKICFGLGGGHFSAPQAFGGVSAVDGFGIADLDSNGSPDVVALRGTSASALTPTLLFNNGSGGVASSASLADGFFENADLRFGDVNGDGTCDLVIFGDREGSIDIATYSNNGSGTFSLLDVVSYSSIQPFDLGDIDNNGSLDVLFPSGTGDLLALLNPGDGDFSVNGMINIVNQALATVHDVAIGDWDLDNDNDVFINLGNQGCSVFQWEGAFPLVTHADIGGSRTFTTVQLGDIDGDGDLDPVFTSSQVGNTSIVKSAGNGGSAGFQALKASIPASDGLRLGDLDGDGDLDAIILRNGQAIEILFNEVAPASFTPLRVDPNAPRNTNLELLYSAAVNRSAGANTIVPHGSQRGRAPTGGYFGANGQTNRSQAVPTISNRGSDRFFPGERVLTTFVGSKAVSATGFIDTVGGGIASTVHDFYAQAGSGPGVFHQIVESSGATSGRYTLAGDFDKDGRVDLLYGTTTQLFIYLNSAAGLPASGTQLFTSQLTSAFRLSSGDFNNDGNLDLVIWQNTVNSSIAFGNGDGSFQALSSPFTSGTGGTAADFDGDGDLDLHFQFASGGLVLLNEVLTVNVSDLLPAPNTYGSAVSDSLRSSFSQPNMQVASAANFVVSGNMSGKRSGTYGVGAPTNRLLMNPDEDFFAGERVNVTLTTNIEGDFGPLSEPFVYEYRATSAAGPSQWELSRPVVRTLVDTYTNAVSGDFDGDGDLDVVASSNANFIFLENDGSGQFFENSFGINANSLVVQETADFNGDGNLDIYAFAYGSTQLLVYLGNGSGGFSAAAAVTIGSGTGGTRVADFDGDGDIDIVAITTDGILSSWRNNGAAVFTNIANEDFTATNSLANLTVGDFNGDGWVDVILGGKNTEGCRVLLNEKDFTFALHQTLVTYDVWNPTSGDVDGDGDLDFIASTVIASANTIYINDGNANFSAGPAIGSYVENDPYDTRLVDYDGDGDLDFVAFDAAGVQFFENNGAGVYSPLAGTLISSVSEQVIGADFDGDGDI
ncbi:MAG: VCBS repeat-containing protein, partial [Planctomycetes bacterium]|nr:VCBS repeat-containing protein [Planctomycetota bacterium]